MSAPRYEFVVRYDGRLVERVPSRRLAMRFVAAIERRGGHASVTRVSTGWGRERQIYDSPVRVEGVVDPETGAGIDALVRNFTEAVGRAGKLPPKAQAEFDARRRS